ncbi:hypothetical protein TNIN_198791 [Trichonephila inaurata madagascariensis]|uniref:Uncharacterized protein n=1 Tax=Trichonephila inaurata madagascariensis TaxID=2747483 RepID=A0A8X6IMU4_9ARAC|nr:hypothetical protein TNIN_198791 [Trichonephila inaurata madagascariensis]
MCTFSQVAAIVVQNFAAQKRALKQRKKKLTPETISNAIEIKMVPYKPKKSIPIQDMTDEERNELSRFNTDKKTQITFSNLNYRT